MTPDPDPTTAGYWTGTHSEPMRQILAGVPDLARSTECVLIAGEFGSGRTALARLVHHRGPRSHAPFFRSMLSREQFAGRGLFAPLPQRPWFGDSLIGSGGTLYLQLSQLSERWGPEIEETIRRIVDDRPIRTGSGPGDAIQPNARVLSSARSDLLIEGRVTGLPADLCARLGAITIRVPPLRERMADFAPFVSMFTNESNRTHRKSVRVDPAVVNLLSGYS
jgi:DNA-binding NtrC family response regulator